MRPRRAPTPADIAAQVLADKGLGTKLPIDLAAVVAGEAVDVTYYSSDRRLDGRIELVDGRAAIFVNTRGRGASHPRARFTGAHEVGHFVQHGRLLRKRPFHDSRIDLESKDATEQQANDFASELLLPSKILDYRFERTRLVDMDFIANLAEEANTSLQATAIRVVRRASGDPICALLVKDDGRVKWVVPSDDWREAKLPWSSLKGKPVPEGSVAARKPTGDYREECVTLSTWVPAQRDREGAIYESARITPFGRLVFLGFGDDDASGDDDERDADSRED